MALASAGPYASHLHLTPDRLPNQHLITQVFYGPDALPAYPTNSVIFYVNQYNDPGAEKDDHASADHLCDAAEQMVKE